MDQKKEAAPVSYRERVIRLLDSEIELENRKNKLWEETEADKKKANLLKWWQYPLIVLGTIAAVFLTKAAIHWFVEGLQLLGILVGVFAVSGDIGCLYCWTGVFGQKESKRHKQYLADLAEETKAFEITVLDQYVEMGKKYPSSVFRIPYGNHKVFDNLYRGTKVKEGLITEVRTGSAGDLLFLLFDQEGNFISDTRTLWKKMDELRLYLQGDRKELRITAGQAAEILKKEDFIILYQDAAFLREHPEDEYRLAFLMDQLMQLNVSDRGNYDLEETDIFRMLSEYKDHFEKGTETFLEQAGVRYYKDFVAGHTNIKGMELTIAPEEQARKANQSCFDAVVVSDFELTVRKKALLIWHKTRLIAVLLEKGIFKDEESKVHRYFDECTIRCWLDNPASSSVPMAFEDAMEWVLSNKCGKRVGSIKTNRWYNKEKEKQEVIATVIHYVVWKWSKYMLPPDIGEEKPEGISEKNWRYWLTLRYKKREECLRQ